MRIDTWTRQTIDTNNNEKLTRKKNEIPNRSWEWEINNNKLWWNSIRWKRDRFGRFKAEIAREYRVSGIPLAFNGFIIPCGPPMTSTVQHIVATARTRAHTFRSLWLSLSTTNLWPEHGTGCNFFFASFFIFFISVFHFPLPKRLDVSNFKRRNFDRLVKSQIENWRLNWPRRFINIRTLQNWICVCCAYDAHFGLIGLLPIVASNLELINFSVWPFDDYTPQRRDNESSRFDRAAARERITPLMQYIVNAWIRVVRIVISLDCANQFLGGHVSRLLLIFVNVVRCMRCP